MLNDQFLRSWLSDRTGHWLFQEVKQLLLITSHQTEGDTDQASRHDARLDFLPVALEMLRCDYPEGYRLILDYYYGDKKVTLLYLAAKYGLTVNKVHYRMQLARNKLKDYIIMHESNR